MLPLQFMALAITLNILSLDEVYPSNLQSVDLIKYTEEEYEKHLTDPVSIIIGPLLKSFYCYLVPVGSG